MEVNQSFVLHAILDQWEIEDIGKGIKVAYGHIYNDTKGRFPDGTFVRTSLVVLQSGDHLQTRNTQYLLGNPVEAGKADIDELRAEFQKWNPRGR